MKATMSAGQTIAIITTNKEVLNGKITDFTSKYISEELSSIGFKVVKISVLTCNENFIACELEGLLKQFDLVVMAISSINELEISCNALAKTFKQTLTATAIEGNQILVPSSARILSMGGTKTKIFPVIHLQGVYVLNTQLENLQVSFPKILKQHLMNYSKQPLYCKTFNLKLNGKNATFNNTPDINIETTKDDSNNILQIKATSTNFCVISQFEENFLRDYSNDVVESDWKIEHNHLNCAENYDSYFKNTLDVIEQCLREYGPENVFVSFNGGKDCTVLLHLVLSVIKKKFPYFNKRLYCVYVQSTNPFDEQNDFIRQCETYYNLDIKTVCRGIKDALASVLKEKPFLKACLMGTRRTDPFSESLQTFQMTDPDWPQIMRVNPLLDWYYSDIWNYLLYFKIPYCKLYDEGYTSLGNVTNTIKNPHLLTRDVFNGQEKYLPAYKLLDASLERLGRT